jgi:hypothetical protein
MSRPPKPFSTPSWVVGRDFPDPNTRLQGTVPDSPAGDSRRGGPLAPLAVRPLSESSFLPPIPRPQNLRPSSESSLEPPIPPAAPPKPSPPAPPTALPPPAPPQSATPPATTPTAEAQPQQPPSPNPPKTRPAAAKSSLQPQTSNYHSGKCSICNHPDRDLIEAAFLNWQPAERIVADFNLPARSTIYRHAKAADLLNQRRNDFRSALDQIIEQAGRVRATASSIVSAIELSYRLSGADIAPLKRFETTHIYIREPDSAAAVSTGGSSDPPAVRPHVESTSKQQSGHANIVAAPNSLNPKEGHHKQSGHKGGI